MTATNGWTPVGPAALGFSMQTHAQSTQGWLIRTLHVPAGLDGPAGILQGGFAAAILLEAARAVDPIGAPVTAIDVRLFAPTPTDAMVEVRVRPTEHAAIYEVASFHGSRKLVAGTVELAGYEPTAHVHDLVEIGRRELPTPQAPESFTDCWMCGSTNLHPYAQRLFPGYVDRQAVLCGWVADEAFAPTGSVDPLVIAAALDCPTGWACAAAIADQGMFGPLLAGYRVQYFRDAPSMEALRIVGHLDDVDGRKLSTRGAMLDDDGAVVAVVSALHVAVAEVPPVTSKAS